MVYSFVRLLLFFSIILFRFVKFDQNFNHSLKIEKLTVR